MKNLTLILEKNIERAKRSKKTVEPTSEAPKSLDDLVKNFPKRYRGDNCRAITGYIPMDYFNQYESEICKITANKGIRRIYRGPRRNAMRTFTRRADAHSVVLYWR